jgi:hypothetical protein
LGFNLPNGNIPSTLKLGIISWGGKKIVLVISSKQRHVIRERVIMKIQEREMLECIDGESGMGPLRFVLLKLKRRWVRCETEPHTSKGRRQRFN